jgi:hypothetical protein
MQNQEGAKTKHIQTRAVVVLAKKRYLRDKPEGLCTRLCERNNKQTSTLKLTLEFCQRASLPFFDLPFE